MEQLPHNATVICAHLLRQGYLKKSCVPRLELDESLFKEVQNNLAKVGMELVYNSYSPFYAVRMKHEAQEMLEESNNLGLKNNEVAMLVILWSKLILPKRLAYESASNTALAFKVKSQLDPNFSARPPAEEMANAPVEKPSTNEGISSQGISSETTLGENSSSNDVASIESAQELLSGKPKLEVMFEEETIKPQDSPSNKIFVRIQELAAEFGEHFGSKTAFKATLTRLSNLQFIRIHNEIITEGIFLDLLVDGYEMANEIKKSALAFKLAGISEEEEDWTEEGIHEEEPAENEPDEQPSEKEKIEEAENEKE